MNGPNKSMQVPVRILVVEDEPAIAETILYALRKEGFDCLNVTLGREALAQIEAGEFALAIFDVGLPDCNGFDLYRQLRQFSEIPVMFLTARADEVDRIVGLEMGADDYVTKPFSPREVAARVKVILRRAALSGSRPEKEQPRQSPTFRIDDAANRIYFAEQAIALTRYEYHLLRTLLEHPDHIFSRDALMQRIWVAPDHSMERTVDAHVKTLRAKLRELLGGDDPIETHRGIGYSWKRKQ